MDEMLKEALRLRRLGFATHWLRPGSKAPIAAAWSMAPVMTEQELQKAYVPGQNLGFRAGKWSVVDGKEICVIDVDVRGGPAYAKEAHAAAAAMLGSDHFDVVSGSGVGRHRYVGFPIGQSPQKSAITLRQSDIWIDNETGEVCKPGNNARPAWLIEILSTGKQVVMPPSIHPDTNHPYQFTTH